MNVVTALQSIILTGLLFLLLTGCSGGSNNGPSSSGSNRGDNGGEEENRFFGSGSPLAITSGNYRKGQDLNLIVSFLQPVIVNTTDGQPSIELTIGDQKRQAVYVRGSETEHLVFRYPVQEEDHDRDGIGVANKIVLNGSEINYALNADVTGAIHSFVPLNVQTPENLSSVKVTNGAILGLEGPLHVKNNSTLEIPVSFSEDVTVTGAPQIEINVGGVDHRAVFDRIDDGNTLIFTYAVPSSQSEGEVTVDGTIHLTEGSSITYRADNVQIVTSVAPAAEPGHIVLIDNTAPEISTVASTVTGGRYSTGDFVEISIPLNEDVFVNIANGTPLISFTITSGTVNATFNRVTDGDTLIFRYTVQNSDSSGDTAMTLTPTIDPNGGSITDRAGNTLESFHFTPPTNLASITIDGTIPTITSVAVDSGYYTVNEEIDITLDISKDVTVSGAPTFDIRLGNSSVSAVYVPGQNRRILLFRYRVQAGENSNGITLVGLNGGEIKDNNDNILRSSFSPPTNLSEIIVDTEVPTITSVEIADGTYSVLDISVHFDGPVNVVGTGRNIPSLSLALDSGPKSAVYNSGDGEATLIFRYSVVQGDRAINGLRITSPLESNTGNIVDLAGNALVDWSFRAPLNLSSVFVDADVPTIERVTIADGNYVVGTAQNNIDIRVEFNEPINVNTVSGIPRILIDVGGVDRDANFASVDGTSTVIFRYTVESSDSDSDGIELKRPTEVNLDNGGSISDLARNRAVLGFRSPTHFQEVKVNADVTPPSIRTVEVTGQNYVTDDHLDISVVFTEDVTVSGGVPTIGLTVGSTPKTAEYISTANSAANTLVFRYTIESEDSDTSGGIQITSTDITLPAMVAIRDGANNNAELNIGNHLPASLAQVTVNADVASPNIQSVDIQAQNYITGANLDISIVFDENVVVNGTPSLGLRLGSDTRTASYNAGASSNRTVVFRYTVVGEDSAPNGIQITSTSIALPNSATIQDGAGNNAQVILSGHLPNLNQMTVNGDSTSPSIVSLEVDDRHYATSSNLDVRVVFDENVTVTGTPKIVLMVGDNSREANYDSDESSNNTLVFRYTVVQGDSDDNGIEITSTAVDISGGATIADSASNNAVLTFNTNLSRSFPAVTVNDTTAPSVTSVSIASSNYVTGAHLDVSVVFDETVTVASGTPKLVLSIGSNSREAHYDSNASSGDTLIFRYTVLEADVDHDGINMTSTEIDITGGATIRDRADNDATRTLNNIPSDLSGVTVNRDMIPPSIRTVSVTGQNYATDDHIDISVVFTEHVTVSSGTPKIVLDIGGNSRDAVYTAVDGTAADTLIFRYTVQMEDDDTSGGIRITSTTIDLQNATIQDGANNNAAINIGDHLPTSLGQVTVNADVTPPAIDTVSVTGQNYATNDNIDISVVFTERVTVSSGAPKIVLDIGGSSKDAIYTPAVATTANTLVFRYTVQTGDSDPSGGIGITSTSIDLQNATIQDSAGNNAAINIGDHLPASLGQVRVNGDVTPPSIRTVSVTGQNYLTDDHIDISVEFSEDVTVSSGTPKIVLNIGGSSKDALYTVVSGTAATTLIFRYTVQSADSDTTGGIGITSTAIDLQNATIQDSSANNAAVNIGDHLPSSLAQVTVNADLIPPSISTVSVTGQNYATGEHIDISVEFSEDVTVSSGTPKIVLDIGGSSKDALYTSVSGTAANTLIFRYTVQGDDSDPTGGIGITSTSIDLQNATIQDGSGNNAAQNIGNYLPTTLAQVTVNADVTPPSITSVNIPNQNYGTGAHLDISVVFDEPVAVSGAPSLAVIVGTTTRTATYTSQASSGNTVVFRYVIVSQDRDTDGIEINPTTISLSNSATIRDRANHNAPNELSSHLPTDWSGIVVNHDTTPPSIVSTSVTGGNYLTGNILNISLTFNEIVEVTGSPNLAVSGFNRAIEYNSGSGSTTLVFRYTIRSNDLDQDGMSTSVTLGQGSEDFIADASRNSNVLGASVNVQVTIADLAQVFINADLTAPLITSIGVIGQNYDTGEHIDIAVAFDEDFVVVGTPSINIRVGATDKTVPYDSDESTNRMLIFRYTVLQDDSDDTGIEITSTTINLPDNTTTIQDSVGNNADRDIASHLPNNLSHVLVNATVPTVVVNGVTVADGEYQTGRNIPIRVVFDAPVTVAGGPYINLDIEGATRRAVYDSGSESTTLTFHYDVQSSDADSNGIVLMSPIELSTGGSIHDGSNNNAVRSFSPPNLPQVTVNAMADVTPPLIRSMAVTDHNYETGEHIDISVVFSEAVTVSGGVPSIALTIGSTAKTANYESIRDSHTVVFRYTVLQDDRDHNGIEITSTTIDLPGTTTIQDSAGNNAANNIGDYLPDMSRVKVNPDLVPPTVSSVSITSGNYVENQELEVRVVFNELVNVANGIPFVELDFDGVTKNALYSSGSGTNTLVFSYTIQGGDNDLSGIQITSINTGNGTIRDIGYNDATLTLGANNLPTNLAQVTVNTSPVVTSIAIASGNYVVGETLEINVTFSEPVTVTGTPSLGFTVGATSRTADYNSSESTNTNLVFRYSVVEEDSDDDGIELTPTLTLPANATIQDSTNNNAVLTFTPPDFPQVFFHIDPFSVSLLSRGIWLETPYLNPIWVDLNRDGLVDLVLGGLDGTLKYYKGTEISFEEQKGRDNPFHNIDVGERSAPAIANIDNDSDWELVVGEWLGSLKYYDLVGTDRDNDGVDDTWTYTERTGSTGSNPNPFDGIDLGTLSNPVFVNIDDDAHLELVVGILGPNSSARGMKYFDFDVSTNQWTQQVGSDNPFNSITIEYSAPAFANLDNDSDLELVVGSGDGTLKYYDLVGSDTDDDGTDDTWTWTEKTGAGNPFNDIDVGTFSNPVFANLTSDADVELIVGAEDGILHYYDRLGQDTDNDNVDDTWTWTDQIVPRSPFYGINVGEKSTPAFGNIDSESTLELVVGASGGTLDFFDLVGSDSDGDNTNDTWTWTQTSLNFDIAVSLFSARNTAPFITNNGVLVVGSSYNDYLRYNLNSGTWNLQTNFWGLSAGDSAPVLINLDDDTDEELVAGRFYGTLGYYDLVGSTWTQRTGSTGTNPNPFHHIDVGDHARPAFANLDTDDELELVIGNEEGYIKYYDLVGTTWTERTGSANPFGTIYMLNHAAPTFANLDSDSDLEIVVGGRDGGLLYGDLHEGTWVYFK